MYFCLWLFWTIGEKLFSFLAKFLGKVQKFVLYVSMGTIYEESFFWRNGFFCMIFGHEAKITQISFETPHEGCHNCILRLHRCFFRKIEVFKSWFFHRFWISDYFFWALAKKKFRWGWRDCFQTVPRNILMKSNRSGLFFAPWAEKSTSWKTFLAGLPKLHYTCTWSHFGGTCLFWNEICFSAFFGRVKKL